MKISPLVRISSPKLNSWYSEYQINTVRKNDQIFKVNLPVNLANLLDPG